RISMRVFGTKSILYSVPRYTSVWPACRPKPWTSVTVMPCTSAPLSASFTSSSLNGFTMAVINFTTAFLLRRVRRSAEQGESAAGGDGDRVPERTHRWRIAEVDVDDLMHVEARGDARGHHVDAFGRTHTAHDLAAEQAAAPLLDDELHPHRRRVGQVRSPRRAFDRRHDELEPGSAGFPLVQTGAPDLGGAHLGDGRSQHSPKGRVPAADVDARDPSLFVGHGAQRDVHRRARDEMERLDAIAGGPHALDVRALALIDLDRVAHAELDARVLGECRVRFDTQPEHHDVGEDRPVVGLHD